MRHAWVVGGMLAVAAGAALAVGPAPAPAEAQSCSGGYDAKGGTNFGGCPPASPVSLYRRLGGREGIRGLVDEFVALLVKDPRVNARFKDMKPLDVERLKTNASDQVCEATGGPCSYLGKDMKTAHHNMKITEAEWNAAVQDLVQALANKGVAERDRNELLAVIAPLKKDIVGQ